MGDERRHAIEQAEAALRDGRAWQARDHLVGHLAQRPADQEVLELLARAWADLGDQPRAGRYWYLTAADTDQAHAARESFRAAHDEDAVQMAYALKVRAPLSSWPEPVQQRLRDLAAEVAGRGHDWRPGRQPRVIFESREHESRWDRVLGWLFVPLLIAGTIGVWVVGLVALVRWLF